MLKKLTVQLNSGLLSQFDSDTTFGIFCWRLSHLLGEEKLKEFLDRYLNDNPVFTISNDLIEVKNTLFFPVPVYIPSVDNSDQSKKEKIGGMLKHKENRTRNYISLRQLNAFLNGNIEEYSKKEEDLFADENNLQILSPGYTSELRVGVAIDRDTSKSKDGQLFSFHPKYLKEGNQIIFLVKIIDQQAFDDFNCEAVLRDVFETGYGKKKSSGFGQCKVIDFKPFDEIKEPENVNGFISLSNYLPAEDDKITSGFYDTKVKYGRLGEVFSLSANPFKQPVLITGPGSCFKTKETKEWYGRVTLSGEISPSKPEVIHFGISFSLSALLV